MRVHPMELPGVLLVEPHVHRDARGFFLETWHQERYRSLGIGESFVQDNHSCSAAGVVRGLHAQVQRPQAKLVRCASGRIFDVCVDIRRGSPTFGHHVAVWLDGDSHKQLFVPAGFAHGFCAVEGPAHVEYKCSAPYDPDDEITIAWDDPDLAIPWPVGRPRLSEKDGAAPRLREFGDRLPVFQAEDGRPR